MLREIKWEFVPDVKAPGPEKEPSILRPYMDFYGLKKQPFTITPDPEFLYSSSTHKTALEDILYGIEASMGFILLIGEVGTGKTTLCRAILDSLSGRAETVYIINPSLSGVEIIEAILDDLGVAYPLNSSKKELLDHLNRCLLKTAEKRPVVIIIDDAQTMTPEGLENLRLLSNLETDKKKLLQLVLAGQPELQGLLLQPELRQLRQRIAICCSLGLIDCSELRQYISLRLFVAGSQGNTVFSEGAIKKIYHASRGIPRLINTICDYSLMAGYVGNSLIIRKKDAERAINELRYQSILEKSLIADIALSLSNKRVRVGLIILLIGLLVLAFIHNDKIFYDKDIPVKSINKTAQTSIAALPESKPKPLKEVVPVSDITEVNAESENAAIIDYSAIPERDENIPAEIARNYIVQLFSYKNMKDAEKGALALRETGIDAHWNSVHMSENGLWYRVYAGDFSTEKDAKAYADEKGFNDGVILLAPWTVIIPPDRDKTMEDIALELKEMGYDCIHEKDKEGNPILMIGAYISPDRASRASQEIINLGYDAKPMER